MIHTGLAQIHDDLKDLLINIDAIAPHPANYNNGDVEAIAESIETNGIYRPVFVQKSTGYIIAGNHTWHAAKMLGAEQIPVVVLDVDDTHATRIMIADNRTAALAVPDNGLLLDLLEQIHDTDSLVGTGYKEYDLEVLRQLNEIPLEEEHASWPLIQVRVPPHIHRAYYAMTEAAVGERERFELLMRLAGWTNK